MHGESYGACQGQAADVHCSAEPEGEGDVEAEPADGDEHGGTGVVAGVEEAGYDFEGGFADDPDAEEEEGGVDEGGGVGGKGIAFEEEGDGGSAEEGEADGGGDGEGPDDAEGGDGGALQALNIAAVE